MDNEETSFGELRTLGRREESRREVVSGAGAWNPEDSIGELTTRGPEGIVDDGRTDGGRRLNAGEEILGRYVVERELGEGGMGVVYECRDKVGGVNVAVKSLPPELSHNSVEMEEVRDNFELVVGLRHPNIAGVRTLEKDGRGEYFLVMDVAEGENLRKWLRRKWKEGGVPPEEAIPILRQVAAALDYAHGKKVVHRDVKPGNVVIDGNGEVKVLDFGLAAQLRTSLSRASQAYRGTGGTGPYMAPEQWRGQPQDGRADQYALGVMAYEMLAGRLPFENGELAVLREVVLKEEMPGIPGLPKSAVAALRRAMAKRKEERWENCGAFVEALAKGGGRRSARGKTLMGWMVTLMLAWMMVGAGAWWWQENGKRQARREESARVAENARLEAERQAAAKEETKRKAAEEARLAEEKRQAEEEQKAAEEEAARQAAETERKAKVQQGLETAREAKAREAWDEVAKAAEGVLALDAKNGEAKRLKETAEEMHRRELQARAEREAEVARELAAARAAQERGAWEEVVRSAEGVLRLEPKNTEAKGLKAEAEKMLSLWNTVTAGKADREVVLLVVPAEYHLLQIAFDLARRYPAVLVSYGEKSVTKLHVWNGYEWLPLFMADYLSGVYLQKYPGRVLLLGDDEQMPEGLERGVPWCDNAKRVSATETAALLNAVGAWLPFSPEDWRWFSSRYNVKLGQYVPAPRGDAEPPSAPNCPPI